MSVKFKEPSQNADDSPIKKNLPMRRSSMFTKLAQSFKRSGGERGAGLEDLRGTHGADFEEECTIKRGNSGCGCLGNNKNSINLVLVKATFCFVFKDEGASAPRYAIRLTQMRAKRQNLTVVLETNAGDVEYEFSFTEEDRAKEFVDVINKQAAIGESNEVRKRLGHQHLLKLTKSIRFAEQIAVKKTEEQPEKPAKLTDLADEFTQANVAVGGF
mmetsp:Transcript_31005/g.34298  ORF Transcript_31005/g.34298 Transcript_31005/m.34298 type:complete len:215 (+) Transcript_31005:65-709(+)|eukprot:CAMPEP_0194139192 /NCGR_PEP_ID=MMETSP0152-20130528/8913_1 /TAXON_ID=1049557 /ORGANISM="Thalassiothrix antarctica, Strain L6-D1" /LENGTH=214 /DNA_ID=CAMNT_0038836969 /DNA_START=60 /DNA_END=704 /DNA_ORIENTATION=+